MKKRITRLADVTVLVLLYAFIFWVLFAIADWTAVNVVGRDELDTPTMIAGMVVLQIAISTVNLILKALTRWLDKALSE